MLKQVSLLAALLLVPLVVDAAGHGQAFLATTVTEAAAMTTAEKTAELKRLLPGVSDRAIATTLRFNGFDLEKAFDELNKDAARMRPAAVPAPPLPATQQGRGTTNTSATLQDVVHERVDVPGVVEAPARPVAEVVEPVQQLVWQGRQVEAPVAQDSADVLQLQEMGFDLHDARVAAQKFPGNIEGAMNFLVDRAMACEGQQDQPHQPTTTTAPQPTTTTDLQNAQALLGAPVEFGTPAVEGLVNLGFTRDEAAAALLANDNNVERAAIWLFDRREALELGRQEEAAVATAPVVAPQLDHTQDPELQRLRQAQATQFHHQAGPYAGAAPYGGGYVATTATAPPPYPTPQARYEGDRYDAECQRNRGDEGGMGVGNALMLGGGAVALGGMLTGNEAVVEMGQGTLDAGLVTHVVGGGAGNGIGATMMGVGAGMDLLGLVTGNDGLEEVGEAAMLGGAVAHLFE